MKKALTLAAVATFALAGVASADAGGVPNEDGNGIGSCFGQARSAGVDTLRDLFGPSTWGNGSDAWPGEGASERKGENSTQNAAFKEGCRP